MSLLKRVKRTTAAPTEERDVLGGRKVFETNVYSLEIKQAFIFVNSNGSTGCRIDGKFEDGQDYSNTLWIADRKGNNYYIDKKDKSQKLLPAYIMLNTILQLVAEKSIDDPDSLETSEKVVKMGETNQSVEVLDDLTGAVILIALEKQRKNKTVKGTLPDGKEGYVPTNEIIFENELVKVFCGSEDAYGFTLNELLADAAEPEFMSKWLEKNKDKEIDRFKPVAENASPAAAGARTGLAAKRPAAPAPRKTLASTKPAADEPEEEELEEEEVEEQEEAPVAAPARRTFTRK